MVMEAGIRRRWENGEENVGLALMEGYTTS